MENKTDTGATLLQPRLVLDLLPETAEASYLAETGGGGTCRVVLAEFANRLETERDAARMEYETETLSTAEMIKTIAELERDKKWLIESGEKLVNWVEGPRHSNEEVRDHNGRIKDTGIWAAFYTAVRGIQRKDTPKLSSENDKVERPAPTKNDEI